MKTRPGNPELETAPGAQLKSSLVLQGYNRLAKIYDALLWLSFGLIPRAQRALLKRIGRPQNILILGEGTGNFLKQLQTNFPESQKTVVELSPEMIRQARKKIDHPHIHWANASALDWNPSEQDQKNGFDLICANFFFDQFSPATMKKILTHYKKYLTPQGMVYFSDFTPDGRRPGRMVVFGLYLFFRKITEIEAERLPDFESIFTETGFTPIEQKKFPFSIKTTLYRQKSPVK